MTTPEALIGRSLGPYRIVEEIGRGGMAVVFRAVDDQEDREVALKVLSTDFTQDLRALERFHREAETCRGLNHPNIIRIFGIGEQDGLHYFAMEFLPHKSLHDLVKSEGKLTIDRSVATVRSTLAGLGAAHAKGVIHRDLKPENIMMNAEGRPVLVDFGIAKTSKGHRLTQTGVLLGTPYYMSPEQITGKEVGIPSDLYSMGVVLYELLTAEVPFQADSTFMITYKHCTEPPPPPRKLNPDIGEDLEKVVLKSLEKDLRKRYQSAEEFSVDLERVQRGDSVAIEVTRKRDIFDLPEFASGMEHYRAKRYAEAREHWTRVIEGTPEPEFQAEANRWSATAYFDQGDFLQALHGFRETARRWPDSEEARRVPIYVDGCCFQQHLKGEQILLEKGSRAALTCFRDFLDLLDAEGVSEEEKAESHWVQQVMRRTRELEERIRRWNLLKWTLVAVSVGCLLGAFGLFLYFRYVDPLAGHLVRARYEEVRGHDDGMVAEYRAALRLNPDHAPALVRLAQGLYRMGKPEEARALAEKVVSQKDRDAAARVLLASMEATSGDLEAALAHLERAVALSPEDPGIWDQRGVVEGRLGRVEAELRSYQQALRLRPVYPEAMNHLALALWRRRDDPAKAQKVLEKARSVAPDFAPTHHNLGKLLMAMGRSEEAERSLLEAVRHDPTEPDTHYHLAILHSRAGLREKATKELLDAVRHAKTLGRPRDRIHYLLGQLREGVAAELSGSEAAQYREEAEYHYKEALLLVPGEKSYAERLGRFYASQAAWENALDAWARWAEIDPGDPEPRLHMGESLIRSGRPQEALAPLAEGVRISGGTGALHRTMAEALLSLGRVDEAVRQLDLALARDPESLEVHAARAPVLLRAGKLPEARAAALELANRGIKDPKSLATSGRVLAAAGDPREATRILESALAIDPDFVPALSALGQLLLAEGKTERGRALLERSLAREPFQDEAARLKQLLARSRPGP